MMGMPELLAPAGGPSQLRTALRYGADAVYTGLQGFSLRARAKNMDVADLREAVEYTHGLGKKIYVTMNAFPWDEEFTGLLAAARQLRDMAVDAVIVSDPGVVSMLRKELPELELHLSTQANTVNAYAASFWHEQGVARVILARELSLERIREMGQRVPKTLQLEAFVHGAMCYAYSGRCLLSTALTGRSANRGDCAQPCRWPWAIQTMEKSPEILPVDGDERGAYVLSAYDLCMLRHLPALRDAGISSFKIEGRMKNDYYVASVVSAYRRAMECPQDAEQLEKELDKVSHRPRNTGFFFGAPQPAGGADGPTQTMEYIGRVEKTEAGAAQILVKNRFFVGDSIEALTPDGVYPFAVPWMQDETRMPMESCNVPNVLIWIGTPCALDPGDILRAATRNHAMPSIG